MNKQGKFAVGEVEKGKEYKKEKEEKLKGFGGWLMLFVIILIANTLYYIFDILFFLDLEVVSEFPLFFLPIIFQIVIIVLFIWALVYLFQYKKKGVKLLKIVLWFPMANAILIGLIFIALEIESTDTFIGVVSGLGFALIWTLYLSKSERVKNTITK